MAIFFSFFFFLFFHSLWWAKYFYFCKQLVASSFCFPSLVYRSTNDYSSCCVTLTIGNSYFTFIMRLQYDLYLDWFRIISRYFFFPFYVFPQKLDCWMYIFWEWDRQNIFSIARGAESNILVSLQKIYIHSSRGKCVVLRLKAY